MPRPLMRLASPLLRLASPRGASAANLELDPRDLVADHREDLAPQAVVLLVRVVDAIGVGILPVVGDRERPAALARGCPSARLPDLRSHPSRCNCRGRQAEVGPHRRSRNSSDARRSWLKRAVQGSPCTRAPDHQRPTGRSRSTVADAARVCVPRRDGNSLASVRRQPCPPSGTAAALGQGTRADSHSVLAARRRGHARGCH